MMSFSFWNIWMMAVACQLVFAHPDISQEMKDDYRGMGRVLVKPVLDEYPGMKGLWEAGWSREYDAVVIEGVEGEE